MKRNNKILIFFVYSKVESSWPIRFTEYILYKVFIQFSIYMETLLLNYIALSYFHYFQRVRVFCGCCKLIKMQYKSAFTLYTHALKNFVTHYKLAIVLYEKLNF